MKQTLAKLNVSHEADTSLNRMMLLVNKDNPSGKVTKTELASWILFEYEKLFIEKAIPRIRAAHFDEISYLENLVQKLRHSKERGGSDPTLEKIRLKVLRAARTSPASNPGCEKTPAE